MRSEILYLAIAVMYFSVISACVAYEPMFRAGVNIEANGSVLDVGTYAIPNVCDWNNDGKKDLIVGQFTNGKVRLYLNSGTDSSPVFTTFTFIQAGGSDISVGGY